MLATLIPLFDDKMTVKAYSIFSQKTNMLLNPSLWGTGMRDGAGSIIGLEVIDNMGADTISRDKDLFVSINNISIFSDIPAQTKDIAPSRIVLLMDCTVEPNEKYVIRIAELKKLGYKLAIRKLNVQDFEPYKAILMQMDYVFLDHKKIDISKAKIYFSKVYPNIKLCAINVENNDIYDALCIEGGYTLYEGAFYRVPVTKGENEVAPLKVNYVELLNMVNDPDFDLTKAADVIGRDTALVLNLLQIVNKMSVNSEITSIRHAAAMLGQKELKKWISTAVTNQLCADKPNEVTRVSLLRAKMCENICPLFDKGGFSQEMFLMGLFSVLDIILDMPMKDALNKVKVSKMIEKALIDRAGEYAEVLDFVLSYEQANWAEIDRIMLLKNMDGDAVYKAYSDSLIWYRDLFRS